MKLVTVIDNFMNCWWENECFYLCIEGNW